MDEPLTRKDLLKQWKDMPQAMGKHVATNNHTCKRIVDDLESAGMTEAASWARWMVWHLELSNQRAERFANELRSAR